MLCSSADGERADAGEVDENAARSRAVELSTALSLDGRTIDTNSGARAERSSLVATTEDEEAAAAAEGVDELINGDASTPLEKQAKPPDDDEDKEEEEVCECFVGGLPPEATEEDLNSLFADLNPLSVRVNRRKKGSGDCKGYGFVVFPSAELAKRACERETTTVRKKEKRKKKKRSQAFTSALAAVLDHLIVTQIGDKTSE